MDTNRQAMTANDGEQNLRKQSEVNVGSGGYLLGKCLFGSLFPARLVQDCQRPRGDNNIKKKLTHV